MVGRNISRSHRSRRGFTLVDVSVTVLLIGIMSAVAAPQFGSMMLEYRVEAAARKIAGDLNYAARSARNRAEPITATFQQGTQNYSIDVLQDPNHPTVAWTIALSDSGFENCIVSGLSLGGDSEITFDIYGRPDASGTVTVSSGSTTQLVSIDQATGKASVL
jgi:Tfp pilus assembly protein FimT